MSRPEGLPPIIQFWDVPRGRTPERKEVMSNKEVKIMITENTANHVRVADDAVKTGHAVAVDNIVAIYKEDADAFKECGFSAYLKTAFAGTSIENDVFAYRNVAYAVIGGKVDIADVQDIGFNKVALICKKYYRKDVTPRGLSNMVRRFIDGHDVESMSTRELKKLAVKKAAKTTKAAETETADKPSIDDVIAAVKAIGGDALKTANALALIEKLR